MNLFRQFFQAIRDVTAELFGLRDDVRMARNQIREATGQEALPLDSQTAAELPPANNEPASEAQPAHLNGNQRRKLLDGPRRR